MLTLEDLLASPPSLPVTAAVPNIVAAASAGACAVLTAPPGTGKTTLAPVAIATALCPPSPTPAGEHAPPESASSIIVTQPRRVAVRAAARRIASLLGQKVGEDVGYSVRGDRQVSARTRIEMVTPGVLLRRLQRDPELPGVAGVVLDEFHERDVDTDLALAFLLDTRAALREDLFIALTSATLEASRSASLLEKFSGAPTRIIDIPGETHPLELRYAPAPRGVVPLEAMGERVGVSAAFLSHVARTVEDIAAKESGDILVFLPGVGEIERVRTQLHLPGVTVLPLHGQLSAADQDRALRPSSEGTRRVVLSTSVAESSLTVPGVRIVVDAGLSREARADASRGISSLVTIPTSRARLDQRAGRAARTSAGVAVRLMDPVDVARRPAQSAPGIVTSDLVDVRLQVATWGSPVGDLALLDAPPAGAWEAAGARLRALGAIDEAGVPTPLGRILAPLPVSAPLGRALVDATALVGADTAARCVALLSEDLRAPGADLARVARELGRGGPSSRREESVSWRVAEQEKRLRALARSLGSSATKDHRSREEALALTAALARPEWIARRRPDSSAFVLAGGVGATLPDPSALAGEEWLAVASLDRSGTSRHARILSALPLSEADALMAGAALEEKRLTAEVQQGRVHVRRVYCLGAIPLSSRRAKSLDAHECVRLVSDYVEREGLGELRWTKEAFSLRDRMRALHTHIGEPWPDVSDEALIARASDWLSPYGESLSGGGRLGDIDMGEVLRGMLPWPQAARLDELAPASLPIPSGGTRPVDWSGEQPTLSLRVQQAFGWIESPRLLGGAVPLVVHLTDPAGRPAAITADLASFWAGPYRDVRAQLRGRYPKHPWPEDPLSAVPTNRAQRRKE